MSTISALSGAGPQTAATVNQPTQPAAPAVSGSPQPIAEIGHAEQTTQAPSQETTRKAAATVEKFVNSQAHAEHQMQFDISRADGLDVVKVIDKASNQVITQYPSKAIVEMAHAIDSLQGLMSTTGILHNSTA